MIPGVLAHIGKIPVEEWLPFLVPVAVLLLYGRRRDRARREALAQLPDVSEGLDRETVEAVMARWEQRELRGLSAAHVALLYPPGPDGCSAGELAERAGEDRDAVETLLEDLERSGYVELEEHEGFDGPCAVLTAVGHDLVDLTEAAVIEIRVDGAASAQLSAETASTT